MEFITYNSEVTVTSKENPEILKLVLRNDKTMTYSVSTSFGMTVDNELNLHHEPLPSSRTDEYIALTRMSFDEALDLAKRYLSMVKKKVDYAKNRSIDG